MKCQRLRTLYVILSKAIGESPIVPLLAGLQVVFSKAGEFCLFFKTNWDYLLGTSAAIRVVGTPSPWLFQGEDDFLGEAYHQVCRDPSLGLHWWDVDQVCSIPSYTSCKMWIILVFCVLSVLFLTAVTSGQEWFSAPSMNDAATGFQVTAVTMMVP